MALGFFCMPKFSSCYTTSKQKWLFQLDLLDNHFIILNFEFFYFISSPKSVADEQPVMRQRT